MFSKPLMKFEYNLGVFFLHDNILAYDYKKEYKSSDAKYMFF